MYWTQSIGFGWLVGRPSFNNHYIPAVQLLYALFVFVRTKCKGTNFLSHSLVLLTVKLIKTSFSRLLFNNQFSWDMNNREFFFRLALLRGNCGVIGDTHDNTPSERMIKSLDTNKHRTDLHHCWAHSLRPSCVMNFVDAHNARPKTAFSMRFLHHCRQAIDR